jgi:hypothetical protein
MSKNVNITIYKNMSLHVIRCRCESGPWIEGVWEEDGAVPWLIRSVAGLSSCRHGFDPRTVNVGFVVDEVAPGQTGSSPSSWYVFCQYHSTIAPYSRIHSSPTWYNLSSWRRRQVRHCKQRVLWEPRGGSESRVRNTACQGASWNVINMMESRRVRWTAM